MNDKSNGIICEMRKNDRLESTKFERCIKIKVFNGLEIDIQYRWKSVVQYK